jgi:hypothetical protein
MEFDINNLISNDKNVIEEKVVTKGKGGRPKISEPRNKKVMVYFTENEYDKLVVEAKENNMALSNYLRLSIINNGK